MDVCSPRCITVNIQEFDQLPVVKEGKRLVFFYPVWLCLTQFDSRHSHAVEEDGRGDGSIDAEASVELGGGSTERGGREERE